MSMRYLSTYLGIYLTANKSYMHASDYLKQKNKFCMSMQMWRKNI